MKTRLKLFFCTYTTHLKVFNQTYIIHDNCFDMWTKPKTFPPQARTGGKGGLSKKAPRSHQKGGDRDKGTLAKGDII